MTVLSLLGGLALLLYGMQLSGEGLQRAAGGHLRHLLTSMTRTRLSAVGAGALVTALIQSSSATTLMLIGFVSAGLMTFRQSLGIILGADIGTTLTVQLLAFNIRDLALLLVARASPCPSSGGGASSRTSARPCSASASSSWACGS